MTKVFAFAAAIHVAASPASACDSGGAFGIKFGDQPKQTLSKLRETKAAIVYAVANTYPDGQFDRYEVNVNARTREIFQIMAVKTITEAPTSTEYRLTQEEKDAASRRGYGFAASYIASLPEALQRMLVDEHGNGSWKGMVSEDVQMHIIGSDIWEVSVICQDIRRAAASLKGVW